MKRTLLLFSITLPAFIFSFFCFSSPVVRAEDPLLKIQALPDQNSVKGGMMFLVHVQVENSSPDTSTEFWGNSCSYEKHWVTDNPGVFIQSWTCNENTLEQITLEPGDVYEKNIILYIPKKDKTEPVTFRLGFKRMSENGDVTGPLWSDPITMDVIVPEELKEVTPSAVSVGVSQAPDQVPGTPVEKSETPSTGVSDPAVPAGDKALVFRDPGIPIKVSPGAEFSIILTSNPTTGFGWKMTLPVDQQTVKFLKDGYIASQKAMMGAPGEEFFKFKAATPGETRVDFVYERPWEPERAPTRKIFTILVQEN